MNGRNHRAKISITRLARFPEFMVSDGLKQLAAAMGKHGADAGALGAVIVEYARYSQAVEDGFTVSDDILAQEVAKIKAIYESNIQTSKHSDLGEFKGYIEVVGEDRFWNEIYPHKLRMQIVIGEWRRVSVLNNATSDPPSSKDWDTTFYALDQELLAKVQVQVMDASVLKTTVAEGLAYMNEFNLILYTVK